MNHCATCKHFEPWKFGDDLDPRWVGNDENLSSDLPPWGTCQAITSDDTDYYERVTGVIAYTWDASGYMSGLSVRASFGCVLHEAVA
jgi:hypothetical protein